MTDKLKESLTYTTVMMDVVRTIIYNKLRQLLYVTDNTETANLIELYNSNVNSYTVGRSFISSDNPVVDGDLIRSSTLNGLMEAIENDLDVLYYEIDNINDFLNRLEQYTVSIIKAMIKHLNMLGAKIRNYTNLNVGSKMFTDQITNTFQTQDNQTTDRIPAHIDTDIERLKIKPFTKKKEMGRHISQIHIIPITTSLRDYDIVGAKHLYTQVQNDPWYISMVGNNIKHEETFNQTFDDYNGALVCVKVSFSHLTPINQIRMGMFSIDRMDVVGMWYSVRGTTNLNSRIWNEITLNQTNDNRFYEEYNFEPVWAKEVCLVLGQKRYVEEKEVSFERRLTAKVIENISNRMMHSIYNYKSYEELESIENPLQDPLKDVLNDVLTELEDIKISTSPTTNREYFLGLTFLEANYISYEVGSSYETKMIPAEGNIADVFFEDETLNVISGDLINACSTYKIKLNDKYFPISSSKNIIIDATTIDIDRTFYTNFLVDTTKSFVLTYNGEIIDSSEYTLNPIPTKKNKHLVTLNNTRFIPNTVIAMKYYPPITTPAQRIYDPTHINTREAIGVPNTIVPTTVSVSDGFYVFDADTSVNPSGVPDYSDSVYYDGDEMELVEYLDERYAMIPSGLIKPSTPLFGEPVLVSGLVTAQNIHGHRFIPKKFISYPEKGIYFGVIREEHNIISGSQVVTTNSAYKRGSIIVEFEDNLTFSYAEYAKDSLIYHDSNKNTLTIDSTGSTTAYLSYIPIDPTYNGQEINLSDHNQVNNFTNTDENNEIQLPYSPYIDGIIIGNPNRWIWNNGLYVLDTNPSTVYEPIIIYVDNRKAINITDYRNTDTPELNEPMYPDDIKYIQNGKKIKFNKAISGQDIRIEYYILATALGVKSLLYRIDSANPFVTPENLSYTLLVNVKRS